MNVYDSGVAEGTLSSHGWKKVESPDKADLVLVNTCSVRENAEKRAHGRIHTLVGGKKEGQKIGVMGCMAQRRGEKIKQELPGLDFVIGTDELETVLKIAERRLEEGVFTDSTGFTGEGLFSNSARSGAEGVGGFVAISRGCSNFCTYCIVPYVRGPLRSRSHMDILEEIQLLQQMGKTEITLLGQNVNSYNDGRLDFAKLLSLILDNTDVSRIRFTTSHPKDFTDAVIDVIAGNKRIARDIHLPLQSGSDTVLEAMNRKYNYIHYKHIVSSLKSISDIFSITSDILVGFPGESDDDFKKTVEAIAESGYSGFFSFKYSVRPGTKGAELEDNVPEKIKQRRLETIIQMGQDMAVDFSRRQKGRLLEVLVESMDKYGKYRGRSQNGRMVSFSGDSELIGSIVPVRIDSTTTWTLKGHME